ncbi:SGNH/GDSL hydrolase family protein [Chromobacterium haemolyticum]|nr:SGNH/GDSL hydrolase family protein [Chromobacterium haemolyticum]
MSYNHTIWSQDSASQPARVNKLIVFGDSLSDTQNMYGASQWRLPNAKSWFIGRFSNDRVWVEYLAEQLKLPIYNWAIGGSAGDQHLVVPGLLQQVESWSQYMQKAANYRPENTLFTMLIGGNDLLNYGRTVDQVIADQGKALERIITAGARHIVVLNLPNLAGPHSGGPGQRQGRRAGAAGARLQRQTGAAGGAIATEIRQHAEAEPVRQQRPVRRPARQPGQVSGRQCHSVLPGHRRQRQPALYLGTETARGMRQSGRLRVLGRAAPHHSHP